MIHSWLPILWGTVAIPVAVQARGLRQRFGGTVAVDGVDLDVPAGTVFGLLGPNGAGKTTTIRVITTLLPAPVGAIEVFGEDVTRHQLAVRRLIGYVPQQLSADASLTGRENVALFARLFDVPRAWRRQIVDAALELAQALVNSPRLLV